MKISASNTGFTEHCRAGNTVIFKKYKLLYKFIHKYLQKYYLFKIFVTKNATGAKMNKNITVLITVINNPKKCISFVIRNE